MLFVMVGCVLTAPAGTVALRSAVGEWSHGRCGRCRLARLAAGWVHTGRSTRLDSAQARTGQLAVGLLCRVVLIEIWLLLATAENGQGATLHPCPSQGYHQGSQVVDKLHQDLEVA